jgi:hypothetical protein
MPKGISLHVGVNRPNPAAFSVPPLAGCVNDAESMYCIAKKLGYSKRRLLTDEDATFERVTSAILDAADRLVAGDIFLFTFAGHGAEVSDEDEEPFEGKDEAIVLYDHMLLDDVMGRGLWPMFEKDVRVLMVADSCHSGTVSQLVVATAGIVVAGHTLAGGLLDMTVVSEVAVASSADEVTRSISGAARRRHLARERDFYKKLLSNLPASAPVEASVLLLAACDDGRDTLDGLPHGNFTEALLEVWHDGDFPDDYVQFRTSLEKHSKLYNRSQQPQLTPPDTPFGLMKPVFAI